MKLSENKKQLLKWCGLFFLGNVALFWLIALRYVPTLFPGEFFVFQFHGKILAGLFIITAYLSHFALLALLPGVFIALLIMLFPVRRLVILSSVFLMTVAVVVLFIDSIIFNIYHYHINGVIISLAWNGLGEQVFGLTTKEYIYSLLGLSTLITIESIFACQVSRVVFEKQKTLLHLPITKKLLMCSGIFLSTCLYVSSSLLLLNSTNPSGRIFVEISSFMPLYQNILAYFVDRHNGLIALERQSEAKFVHLPQVSMPLHYPLEKNLQFTPSQHAMNVLVVVIDTWRFDMLNKDVMPFMSKFASKSWMFSHHYSGGNATAPGIFTLFYGVPATYWTAMQNQHQGPVLINELLNHHYQMGIFSSASLQWPAFNRTVFQSIQHLQLSAPGKDPYQRDLAVTHEFQTFLSQAVKNPQPFFSFVFYDSAHGYCDFSNDVSPFHPVVKLCNRLSLTNKSDPVPYLNRYKNALHLVDQQIQQVIAALEVEHVLDHTVVIVTGDHGEEFNDNHLGFWGHTSNYTRYQVQTPLLVFWPGQDPKVFTHITSHFDIVPTLMEGVLGCKTPSNTYSVGFNLCDRRIRPYLIVSSYIDFGVITQDQITRIYPLGNFEIDHLSSQPIPDAKLNIPTMQLVFKDLKKFYRTST